MKWGSDGEGAAEQGFGISTENQDVLFFRQIKTGRLNPAGVWLVAATTYLFQDPPTGRVATYFF